jgi:1-acyl-sn-glycerol-3-phosphate acyltransferase
LPILPVTLVGTRDVLPADSLRLTPGRVRMVLHTPIPAADRDPRRLLEETRARIASALPDKLQAA